MRKHTGIKPIGRGTHEIREERKKYKINHCLHCVHYNKDKLMPCTIKGHNDYIKIRYNDMKGYDCYFFRKE
jgi:hypothetical protein